MSGLPGPDDSPRGHLITLESPEGGGKTTQAARLAERVLRPPLARGAIVLVDRYADSTLAYQAFGRGLDRSAVQAALEFATGGLRPDLTLLLDIPVQAGLARKQAQVVAGSVGEANRFESEAVEFHQRVRAGYLQLARESPEHWRIIDAAASLEAVSLAVWAEVQALLERASPAC